jgi:tRNA wybutosine-synthesizing protein 1
MVRKTFERENPEKLREILRKNHYIIIGNSSGVQICRWTKNSLNKKGRCWKEKFYGIKSHKCCQFSPAIMWCENKCLHCWRPIELNLGGSIPANKIDEPKEIIKRIIRARKELLIGFKGNKKVSKKKFSDSLEPSLFTLSLSGEPTIYPKLEGLIKEIRKRKAVSFLVTNGLNPGAIEKLEREKALPTQLTVSLNAPNKKLFKIWTRSTEKNAWKSFLKTLDLLKKLKGKTRRVIRLTLVKKGRNPKKKFNNIGNMEKEHIKQYIGLIKKAEPDFIHVKGFMSVGWARERMGYDKQPWHYEVKDFAEKLADGLKKQGYKILDEEERSCVVLLGKSQKGLKINMKKV